LGWIVGGGVHHDPGRRYLSGRSGRAWQETAPADDLLKQDAFLLFMLTKRIRKSHQIVLTFKIDLA